MCSMEQKFLKNIRYRMKNELMLDHLARPHIDGEQLFYRQNEINKATTLPHYQMKGKTVRKCGKFYPCRARVCFPAEAPLCSRPMMPRTTFATRPLNKNKELKLPNRGDVMKTYTRKLKIIKRDLS